MQHRNRAAKSIDSSQPVPAGCLRLPASSFAQVATMSTVMIRITDMFNVTQTIEDLDPSLSTYDLKHKYTERTGHPPQKQNLWFPVPEGTEGSQPSSQFPWWDKSVRMKTKPQALLDSMAKSPLKLADDGQTLGGMATLQAKAASQEDVVQFYMILNLRGRRRSSLMRMELKKSGGCCSVQ